MPIITSEGAISKNGFQSNAEATTPYSDYYYYSASSSNLTGTAANGRPVIINDTAYVMCRGNNQTWYSYTAPIVQYILKYDSTGNATALIPNMPQDYPLGQFAIDSSGNIHVAFDNSPSGSVGQVILRKYDSSGTLLTSKSFNISASTAGNGNTIGMYIDSNDMIYLFNTRNVFTKIDVATYTVQFNYSYSSGFGTVTTGKLIGYVNGVFHLTTNSGLGQGLIGVSNAGTVIYYRYFNPATPINITDACISGNALYAVIDQTKLLICSLTSGSVSGAWTIPNTSHIAATSYGNLLLSNSGTITPVKISNPTSIIGYPYNYYNAASPPFDDAFFYGIYCSSTNAYMFGRYIEGSPTTYGATSSIKLPIYGNFSFSPVTLNFTLNGKVFDGTLTSTVQSAPTITSTTITSNTSGTSSRSTVATSTGTPTISTSAITVYNYNQQLV